MKYNIGINQLAIISEGWDIELEDAAIFDMLKDFANSPKVKKMIEGEKVYYWFSWKLVVEQLPIIKRNSRSTILTRFSNLVNAGLLEPNPNNQTLAQSWFCFGKNLSKMIFCEVTPIQKTEHPLSEKQTPYTENNIGGIQKTEHPLSEKLNTTKENRNTKENRELNSEIDISQTPTSLNPIVETAKVEQLGKVEELAAKEPKTVYLSANEINTFVCPVDCNNGLFMLLRKFAANRAAKKAKAHKITQGVWDKMLCALKEWAKVYASEVLAKHLEKATEVGCTWISPFYSEVSKTLDGIQRDLQKLGQNTAVANTAQVAALPTEPPFQNPNLEAKYRKTIFRIQELFPAIQNTAITNLTRKEFADIFVKRWGFIRTKMTETAIAKLISDCVTKVATNNFAHKTANPIFSYINLAISAELKKIEEAQNG